MSTQTAQAIVVAVTAVAGVVWLIGLWFLVASYRTGRIEQPADHFGEFEPLPPGCVWGSVEVDGQPSALLGKLTSLLVRQMPGSVNIVEKTTDRLAFEGIGPIQAGEQPQWGQVRFTALGSGRTRIDYAIATPAYRWLLWLGGFFLACGVLLLAVGGWVISAYCLPSPDPHTRAQTLQLVQVAHSLWLISVWYEEGA